MTFAAARFGSRGASGARLAPRIALGLFVKIIGLILIWLLFVRDQRVSVDARSTAAAFGLVGTQPDSTVKSEGPPRGQ